MPRTKTMARRTEQAAELQAREAARKPSSSLGLQRKLDKSRATPGEVKGDRFRPGKRAAKEIYYYQHHCELLLRKVPFQRLVREIAFKVQRDMRRSYGQARDEEEEEDEDSDDPDRSFLRFESAAVLALQEASEAFLVGLYEDANLCVAHCKRVTLMKKDLDIVQRVRNDDLRY
mmetsp:Transcript_109857/g.309827  ORF Transcript_109857/g.309827 Transcript_109857/m.309827 type:complete len:174 (-) Transcript_109857:1-522(-)